MKTSKDARKLSKKLFLGSFSEGRLDEAKVRTIAQTVIDQKPRKYTEILKNYQRLVRVEVAKRHAVIESATDLAETCASSCSARFAASTGRTSPQNSKSRPNSSAVSA